MESNRTVTIENAKMIFRNFSGNEGQYNRAGDRSFGVLLDTDLANTMAADGWNVKWLKPREPGDEEQAYLSIAVNFSKRPPRVVLITSRGRTFVTEETVDMLDWADIAEADLIIRPYTWEVNGKTGVKAYLQSLYVTINEDELELKYANIEE